MDTGQTITDTTARPWRVGQRLGRGLWGTSYSVRGADDREWVLKVAHTAADFPADAPIPDALVKACAQSAREVGALLGAAPHPAFARLEAAFDLPDGRPALLLPRYPSSLRRKLDAGAPLSEILDLLLRLTTVLEDAGKKLGPHGNLRPSNILINERGEVVLTDPLTPSLREHWRRLADLSPDRRDYTPLEATGAAKEGWDAWVLCLVLFESAMHADGDSREPDRITLPREGLDKVQLATVRDHAQARLKREGANPRFLARVVERLGAVLHRGITRETDPSPPYRFDGPTSLRPRLAEVAALVHPKVENVGRLLTAVTAKDGVFQGGAPVEFSVNIATSAGLTEHEHLACGVQVTDLDAEEDGRIRVPDTKYTVQAHPSGRLRFQFSLPDLPPGRYRARVAFAVKDSGDEPQVAEGDFEVRPPPGYVPPTPEPAPVQKGPIPIALRRAEIDDPDEAIPLTDAPTTDGGFGSEADPFPTPVAPSSPGVDAPQVTRLAPTPVRVEHEPTVVDMPSMDAPPSRATPHGAPARDGDTPPSVPRGVAPPSLVVRPASMSEATPVAAPVRIPEPEPWDDAPSVHDDLDGSEPWVPGTQAGEDLPDWEESKPTRAGFDVGALVERVVEIARRDAYAFFLVGLAGVLAFLFLIAVVARLVIPMLF